MRRKIIFREGQARAHVGQALGCAGKQRPRGEMARAVVVDSNSAGNVTSVANPSGHVIASVKSAIATRHSLFACLARDCVSIAPAAALPGPRDKVRKSPMALGPLVPTSGEAA